jgi:hypothetical protein
MTDDALSLAPDVCTLPTAERPLRLAEFDQVFADSLRAQDRPSPTRLHWQLGPASETGFRDLAARETTCCSFFTFTITPSGDSLHVDVDVPDEQVTVLDALQTRAATRMTA